MEISLKKKRIIKSLFDNVKFEFFVLVYNCPNVSETKYQVEQSFVKINLMIATKNKCD